MSWRMLPKLFPFLVGRMFANIMQTYAYIHSQSWMRAVPCKLQLMLIKWSTYLMFRL